MKRSKKRLSIRKVANALLVVLGLVLIWRGIWHGLDGIDAFFGGSRLVSVVASVALGVLILYMPDKDIKEIEKL